MKRRLKLAASVLMILGVAIGIAISYTDQVDPNTGTLGGCPVYPGRSTAFNGLGVDWNGYRGNGSSGNGALAERNYIDREVFAAWQRENVKGHANLCSNEEFVRRIYLDLTGKIPTAEQAEAFLAKPDRNQLIEDLLDSPEYVDRWTQFFGDLLNNTYSLLYYGRNPYNDVIRDFVASDKPYDQFMRDLITAQGDSWALESETGAVNFYARAWANNENVRDTIDNVTADIGRVFLGEPYMCVSCHIGRDHVGLINLYFQYKTRIDFWGVAAFISDDTSYRRQNRGGNQFEYTFGPRNGGRDGGYSTVINAETRDGGRPPRNPANQLYPPIYFSKESVKNPEPPKGSPNFKADLADLIKEDRQFARATTNYLFRELVGGIGVVDAPDSFDRARLDPNNPPSDEEWPPERGEKIQPSIPSLMEALADDFIAHDFSIKNIIRTIVQSSTYQLSAEFPGEWEGRYLPLYARHNVRRMNAESVLDALAIITGVPTDYAIPAARGGSAQWAMQLPDPTEPAGNNPPLNTTIRIFLDKFFRGSRDGSLRLSDGSVQQVLELTNNRLLVYDKVKADVGIVRDLLAANPDDSEESNGVIVDKLFMAALSRKPTDLERSQALQRLDGQTQARWAETLLYALVNKLDFLLY